MSLKWRISSGELSLQSFIFKIWKNKAFLVRKSCSHSDFSCSKNLRRISLIFLIPTCLRYCSLLPEARFLLHYTIFRIWSGVLFFLNDPILRLEKRKDPNIRQNLKWFLRNIIKIDSINELAQIQTFFKIFPS